MSRSKLSSFRLIAALVFAIPASPAVVGLSNLASLAANDSVGWLQLGAAIVTLPGTVNPVSDGGMSVTASSTAFQRVDEGYGWTSNFTLDHQLLWNMSSGSEVVFTFAEPVRGGGAYIQCDTLGAFTGTVTAYFGTTKLGSFTITGSNDAAQDGSAPFLGIMSDSANITSLVFSERSASGVVNEFALDTLQLATATTTPEPATLSLTAAALLSLTCAVWRARRS